MFWINVVVASAATYQGVKRLEERFGELRVWQVITVISAAATLAAVWVGDDPKELAGMTGLGMLICAMVSCQP